MMGYRGHDTHSNNPEKALEGKYNLYNENSFKRQRKYGFFYGSSAKRFHAKLSLPQSVNNITIKKKMEGFAKSKKILFIKSINLEAMQRDFTFKEELSLRKFVRRTKYLKQLIFSKRWDINVSSHFIKNLASSLAYIYYLEKVKIDLYGCSRLNGEKCKLLWRSLARGIKIKDLDLNMVGCNNLDNPSLLSLGTKVSKMKTLRSLSIDLSNTAIFRNQPISNWFIDPVSKLKKLDSLKLLMNYDTQVNNEGLSHIAGVFSEMTPLKKIHIGLGSCDINSVGVKKLSEALSNLKLIEEITLELWSCAGVNDDCITSLAENIGNLTSVRNFALNISNCIAVTDKGLVSFCISLQKLSSLQKLELTLHGCTGIGSESIVFLTNTILSMKVLNDLELNLGSGPNLTEYGFNLMLQRLNKKFENKDNLRIHK